MASSYEQKVRADCIGSNKILQDGSLIQALFIEKWSEEDKVAVARAYISKVDELGNLTGDVRETFLLIRTDTEDVNKLTGFKIENPDSSGYRI